MMLMMKTDHEGEKSFFLSSFSGDWGRRKIGVCTLFYLALIFKINEARQGEVKIMAADILNKNFCLFFGFFVFPRKEVDMPVKRLSFVLRKLKLGLIWVRFLSLSVPCFLRVFFFFFKRWLFPSFVRRLKFLDWERLCFLPSSFFRQKKNRLFLLFLSPTNSHHTKSSKKSNNIP